MVSPVPAKSTQAAPGFSLPQWNNHSNNFQHRGRGGADSSPQHETTPGKSPVVIRKELSPMRDSSSESDIEKRKKSSSTFPQAEGTGKHGSFGSSSSSDQAMVKADKPPPAEVDSSDHDKDIEEAKESKSKETHFRIKRKYTKKNKKPYEAEAQEEWKAPEGAEADESLLLANKKWNLRPRRRHTQKQSDADEANPPLAMAENKVQPPQRLPKGSAAQKESRPKFSISLTREEIQEDLYVMSGLKPPKRSKRRSKSIQKQLDKVFPGLCLSSTVTSDKYKVSAYHHMKD